ncbi:MAG TPA: hypothetical protein VFM88_20345 [Vicinamibacteria bacterium]|nr:hypothetical protein [Vicinamibacteria bacterium]
MSTRLGLAALALLAVSCKLGEPKATRESVTPALQQEAQKLKAEGERMPDLGVKATWNVLAVEVREQKGSADQPFAGTIRFRIDSSTHALEGPSTQSFEKKFDYVYDAASKQWRFRP